MPNSLQPCLIFHNSRQPQFINIYSSPKTKTHSCPSQSLITFLSLEMKMHFIESRKGLSENRPQSTNSLLQNCQFHKVSSSFFFSTQKPKKEKKNRIPFSRGRVIRSCNFPNTLLAMDPLNLHLLYHTFFTLPYNLYHTSLVWCKH